MQLKPLNYSNSYTDLVPEGKFRISPSQLTGFFSDKKKWFREAVKGEREFLGNQYSLLGTCIHRIAEEYTKVRSVQLQELEDYVNNFDETLVTREEKDFILSQLRPMGQALIDHLRVHGIPDRSEEEIAVQLTNNVYLAGTADAVFLDTLIDYKTTSSLTAKNYIPDNYKKQLLTYAYIYNKMGVNIERIRIIWITNNIVDRISDKTGKRMKDYPSTVTEVTELVTEEDLKDIERELLLVAETYEKYLTNPELAYLLYEDMTLKGQTNV